MTYDLDALSAAIKHRIPMGLMPSVDALLDDAALGRAVRAAAENLSDDGLSAMTRAIHDARFAMPGREREPWPMDDSDAQYAFRLAQAAARALVAMQEQGK